MEKVTSQSSCLFPRSQQFQSFSKQILLTAKYKIWHPRVESGRNTAPCGLWSPKLDHNSNNPRVPEDNKHSSEQWMKPNRTKLGRQRAKQKQCTCCIMSFFAMRPSPPSSPFTVSQWAHWQRTLVHTHISRTVYTRKTLMTTCQRQPNLKQKLEKLTKQQSTKQNNVLKWHNWSQGG